MTFKSPYENEDFKNYSKGVMWDIFTRMVSLNYCSVTQPTAKTGQKITMLPLDVTRICSRTFPSVSWLYLQVFLAHLLCILTLQKDYLSFH